MTVRLYLSVSLARRFGEAAWTGREARDFTVLYSEYDVGDVDDCGTGE